jgi:hypothetical protein
MYESEHDDAHYEQEIAHLSDEIEKEQALWDAQHVHAGMLSIDAYLIQMKVNALTAMVKQMGMSEGEMQAMFKASVLAQMQEDRAMLVKARAQASRPDIALPQRPPLLGPNGSPFS